ncbi:sialate O-acetylesterase [Hymenobacter sp.]|uniref:sialate O-acetylesterase n=1 Tax=Hymenobacter sp. TaxID=1898978 RepID=UPI00286BD1F9|nr:sialate O-acetylesterase [Hymenobacter sp.]
MKILCLALLPLLLAHEPARATVRLPRLVGDHMVLQRDQPLPLWGWAGPGEAVSVTFRGKAYAATTGGPAGKWTVTLPPTPAGGPYALLIKGSNEVRVADVLVGDVWLAAGQSNMEWPVRDATGAAAEIAAATYPTIRRLDVPNVAALSPQAEFGGAGWQVCSPRTVGEFSAVAYFFARDLHQHNPRVPLGLITADWGGTPAEAWTSAPALRTHPDFAARVAVVTAAQPSILAQQADYRARVEAWQASPAGQDQGRRPGQLSWAAPGFSAANWPAMPLPGYWEGQAEALRDFDGVVWLRKEFTLTAAEAGQPAQLALARIDDDDSTWVNGVPVGGTRGYYPIRRYAVPGPVLQAGRNVIAVRVVDNGGGGGIWGAAADMRLTTATRTVPLAGAWQYHPAYDPATQPPNPFPGGPEMLPTALFNGMIAPLLPYALAGVIWYQGETNAPRAEQYRTLFANLIRDWRAQWQRPALPFLFVQLAGYQPTGPEPAESAFAELREAQQLALALPATGMATAVDVGDSTDLHPRNKQAVGRRLALAARRVAYRETATVASGPVFTSLTVSGNTARLRFTNQGTGLVLKDAGGPYLKGFALAGADRKFWWAQGEVQGDAVVLRCPAVPAPVAVRYAWGNMPFVNLYNREGLPAPPFRTDAWPGLTAGKR